ncbi:hypothetical protein D3C78_1501120 [compost metagenome]
MPVGEPGLVDLGFAGLGDQRIGQPPVAHGPFHESGDGRMQARPRRFAAVGDRFEHVDFALRDRGQHFHAQVGLGREIAIDRSRRHTRRGGHMADLGLGPSAFAHQGAGSQQDAVAVAGEAGFNTVGSAVSHEEMNSGSITEL